MLVSLLLLACSWLMAGCVPEPGSYGVTIELTDRSQTVDGEESALEEDLELKYTSVVHVFEGSEHQLFFEFDSGLSLQGERDGKDFTASLEEETVYTGSSCLEESSDHYRFRGSFDNGSLTGTLKYTSIDETCYSDLEYEYTYQVEGQRLGSSGSQVQADGGFEPDP